MDGTKLSKTMVEVGFNDVDQIESSYFDSLFLDTKWFKTMIMLCMLCILILKVKTNFFVCKFFLKVLKFSVTIAT